MKSFAYIAALGIGLAVVTNARADEPPAPATEVTVMAAAEQYLERARDVMFYALSLIGINYRFGGNSPQTGFDCSGFVRHVYQQIAGLILPRDSYAMSLIGIRVSIDDLKPGDLVFYNTRRRPYSHVGIYLGDRRFVHAPSSGKSVEIVDMADAYWAKRFNGARRVQQ